MPNQTWLPSASIYYLKQRAEILNSLRQFFYERDIMEVDTPVMSHAAVTDIHLHTFQTHFFGPGYSDGAKLHLSTSPEFHMKRLLAAGSGAIFQISKAFRNEEAGRFHNPEFSMLEWYRPDFDHHQLMEEVNQLLTLILKCDDADYVTYQQLFRAHLNCCPLEASIEQLRCIADAHGLSDIVEKEEERDTLLQLLFSTAIEPNIAQEKPLFVYEFPASQAALAKISARDPRVAERFEVYFKGIELANGFNELDNAAEQLTRFKGDNAKRALMGLDKQPIDYHLISALENGFPPCSGVALGIDRLVMLALEATHIEQVIAFPFERA